MSATMPKIQKGYKQTEIGVIPEDWEVKQLGDIASVVTGSTPPTIDQSNYGGEYFFVSPSDLGERKYILQTEKKLSKKGFGIARKFPRNSILFTCIGSTIGKSGIALTELTSNQQINAILPNERFFPDFLFYALGFRAKEIQSLAGEQAVPMVNKTEFEKTNLALPKSKLEQKAIAEVLSDTDALIERLGQLIEKKRWIKQGAMQRLLTGKQRLPGFTKKWERVALGLLLDYEQPTKYLVSSTEYDDGFDTPVLTVGKTFLLGRTNERHGIFTKLPCIIFDDFTTQSRYVDFPFKAKSSAMKMLLPKSETENLRFISEQMQRIEFTLQGHKRYWISEYAKLEISLPEPKEQEAIISILSDMDAEIEALERQRAKYRNIKQGMMQSLLTGRIRLPLS